MAAISQKVSPEEVLPLLARNVVINGYHGSQETGGRPTEYLVLLRRYVEQARELVALAGPGGVIRVADCAAAKPLLAVIGYRLRQPCGKDAALEAADSERAFLTLDSGFPLATLEETLRGGNAFAYSYPVTQVPVLFTSDDWTALATGDKKADVLESLLYEPMLARLYWGMAHLDDETRLALRQSPGLFRLLRLSPVLNFYGSQICIRAGRVAVPGGATAEPAWKTLVAADPGSPGDFVLRLFAKDEGWLAAYFDALSRVPQSRQAYFTEPRRLQRFYAALRGHRVTPGAARPVLRPAPGLLLLVFRLRFEPDGTPSLPGNLRVWKDILHHGSDASLVREWDKRATHWNHPDDVVEAMFALSRLDAAGGPVPIFLALNELDRGRAPEQRLSPQNVRLLADRFSRFSSQYSTFAEFHALNNASIARFLAVAAALDRISDPALRANAVGLFQAVVGLWQILARQHQIADARGNDSWQQILNPFAAVRSSAQVFDAGRTSLRALLQATTGKPGVSQDELVRLLAGPELPSAEAQQMRQELANRMRSVLQGQRLVSLDTLFALADGLDRVADGQAAAVTLLPLAAELRDFELPRPLFSNRERTEWAAGGNIATDNPHTALQARTDWTRLLNSAPNPRQLAEARSQLAAFLRDTLVGLDYAYYEPPGAQMLHHNPLFVRSHDFSGRMTMTGETSWQTPRLLGAGVAAGRGGHLVGSLADLPYVLSQVEQDFIVPENVQALIWNETVPTLVTSAILPRWWRVTRNELHAVALFQRAGEELLTAAAGDEQLRAGVANILSDRMLPRRLEQLANALRAGHLDPARSLTPADSLYLAAEFRRRFPEQDERWGPAASELTALARQYPAEVSWERLSGDFGVPHPAMAQTYGRELLNVKPFPALSGYGSRLLAESWDSTNLYWARLADEQGYPPVLLHRLVPDLTRRMVEKIFATDLEDWPALARALRETGDEFRRGRMESPPPASSGFQP